MTFLPKLSPMQLLTDLLNSQDWVSVSSGDYDDLSHEISQEGDEQYVTINTIKITFVFDKDGRFQGISNWKE